VAKLNPDWLFVIDRDAATGRPNAVAPQKILTGTALKKTTAVKKGQVVYLPAAEVYLSGGIVTAQHVVERVSEALNRAAR
jgi:iron complex transport system substrate-binding protein